MKRIYEFDVIRSLCFIWIVAVWHLNSYLISSLHYSGYVLDLFHNITYAALGMFTFLSGVLLSKYQFYSFKDLSSFYKKRLSKFFLLLLISTLSYRIVGWIDTKQVFQVICGVNLFLGPSVPTLWFFSMMVFFYIVTPIIMLCYSKKYQTLFRLSISLCVYLLICADVILFSSYNRLLFYFPIYFLGLYMGSDKLLSLIHSKWLYFLIPFCLLLFIGRLHPIISELTGGILFILGGKLAFPLINNFWRFVSISSMIAYLFHRQYFSLIMRLFELQGMTYISSSFAIGAFVILVVISYYSQTIIDNLKK